MSDDGSGAGGARGAPTSEIVAAPPRRVEGRRSRGLVPVQHHSDAALPGPPPAFRVRVAATPTRLPARPWRAIKLMAALFVISSVAFFAAVQGVRVFSDSVDTDKNRSTIDGYAQGRGGSEFVEDEDGFVIVFPAQPVRGVTSAPGRQVGTAVPEVMVEVDGVDFSIVWFDLEGETDDPAGTLSFIAAVSAADLGGDPDDQRMLPTAPVPAHEFAVTTSERVNLVRHVLAGTRIFQLVVSATGAEEAAFERFADSFDLIGEGLGELSG